MTRPLAALLFASLVLWSFPSQAKKHKAHHPAPASKARSTEEAIKQDDKVRRAQEEKSRRVDAEMRRMMGSVCRGC